jgi:fatty-acid desaturase
MLKQIKNTVSDMYLMLSIFIVGFLIYDHSLRLVWALLVAWIIANCTALIVHEGWSHQYIVPKNKYFGYVLDYLAYLSMSQTKLYWKKLHIDHHKYWKTEHDHVQWSLDNNHWFTYIFSDRKQYLKNIFHPQIISRDTKMLYDNMDKFSVFMDQHHVLITIPFHILIVFLFGFNFYFYFILLQIWLFSIYMLLFGEILPHRDKRKEQEHNLLWLFPLCLGNAYHFSHHTTMNTLFLGTGWIKYINPQYYFIKLFYKVTAKIR